ncbi:glycosyltransferase [Klebsiella pneumoniae]
MDKYSILIPTYNNSLVEIKNTFSCFNVDEHILVIDDGSDKPFLEITKDLLHEFSNLKVITLSENQGIENALRLGVAELIDKYQYIARMDIGDLCDSSRFAKQYEFMTKNQEYVIVGTWTKFLNESGQLEFLHKTPVEDSEIRKNMYKNNMFVHPSVMLKSSTLKLVGSYSTDFKACEDYELFFRMLHVGKGYNIPEFLTSYEVNYNSISSKKRRMQISNRIRVILKNFEMFKYGIYPYYGLIRSIIMICLNRKQSTLLNRILKKNSSIFS